ncbi:MAG: DUF1801 domain-containing protein [Gammaproteobacteria bacterium]
MITNDTHGTFEELMASIAPDMGLISQSLRNLILSLHPDAVELVWTRQRIASYGVGPKKMTQHYAYIAPQTKHVNLGFYRGSGLADPEGILEGTGKHLRHVKIRHHADTDTPVIEALIIKSIAGMRGSDE